MLQEYKCYKEMAEWGSSLQRPGGDSAGGPLRQHGEELQSQNDAGQRKGWTLGTT